MVRRPSQIAALFAALFAVRISECIHASDTIPHELASCWILQQTCRHATRASYLDGAQCTVGLTTHEPAPAENVTASSLAPQFGAQSQHASELLVVQNAYS